VTNRKPLPLAMKSSLTRFGRIFYEKYRPNDLGAIFLQNSPKFTLVISIFGLHFVLKLPNFDLLRAKVIYYDVILGAFYKTSGNTDKKVNNTCNFLASCNSASFEK
jgi:hypothetical protein